MKTPQKITGNEFIQQKVQFEEKTTAKSELGFPLCKKCRSGIKTSLIYISLHIIDHPCDMNSGEVLAEKLPYCPQCEVIPEKSGCVHV